MKHGCPRRQRSQNMAKSRSPTLWHSPRPRGMWYQRGVSNPYMYLQSRFSKCIKSQTLIIALFSSPEPKAQVSYWHSASSVRPSVRRRLSSVRRPSSVNFHIDNFFSRTAWWILMKLGMHEVLIVPYMCCCFSARSAQGRIQGGDKIGHRGPLSSRNFFFRPDGYSDKPNA